MGGLWRTHVGQCWLQPWRRRHTPYDTTASCNDLLFHPACLPACSAVPAAWAGAGGEAWLQHAVLSLQLAKEHARAHAACCWNGGRSAGVHRTLSHPAVAGQDHLLYIRTQQFVLVSFHFQQEYKDPESSHIAEEGWRLMVAASGVLRPQGCEGQEQQLSAQRGCVLRRCAPPSAALCGPCLPIGCLLGFAAFCSPPW